MVPDGKSLLYMVTRNNYSAERRVMIDMAAIRYSYRKKNITRIAQIVGKNNPADEMTKVVQNTKLRDLMVRMKTLRSVQWIARNSGW